MPPQRLKPPAYQILLGVLGILSGFYIPIRHWNELPGGLAVTRFLAELRWAEPSIYIEFAMSVLLGIFSIACGLILILNRSWAPWVASLTGGAVLVEAFCLLAASAPMYVNVIRVSATTRYYSVAIWAGLSLFLDVFQFVWALTLLSIALSARGRRAFPPATPPFQTSTLRTTAIISGLSVGFLSLFTHALGWMTKT